MSVIKQQHMYQAEYLIKWQHEYLNRYDYDYVHCILCCGYGLFITPEGLSNNLTINFKYAGVRFVETDCVICCYLLISEAGLTDW